MFRLIRKNIIKKLPQKDSDKITRFEYVDNEYDVSVGAGG